MIITIILC